MRLLLRHTPCSLLLLLCACSDGNAPTPADPPDLTDDAGVEQDGGSDLPDAGDQGVRCVRGPAIEVDGVQYPRAALSCDAPLGCSSAGFCVPVQDCAALSEGHGVPCLHELVQTEGGIDHGALAATNRQVTWLDHGPSDALGNYLHRGLATTLGFGVESASAAGDHPRDLSVDPRSGQAAWLQGVGSDTLLSTRQVSGDGWDGFWYDADALHAVWRLYDGAIWSWDSSHRIERRSPDPGWYRPEDVALFATDAVNDMLVTDQAIYLLDGAPRVVRIDRESHDVDLIATGRVYERLLGSVAGHLIAQLDDTLGRTIERLDPETGEASVVVLEVSSAAVWDDYLYFGAPAGDVIFRQDLRLNGAPEFVVETDSTGEPDSLAPISDGLFWVDGSELSPWSEPASRRRATLHFLPLAGRNDAEGEPSATPFPPTHMAGVTEDRITRDPPAPGERDGLCLPQSLPVDGVAQDARLGTCNFGLACGTNGRCFDLRDCSEGALSQPCHAYASDQLVIATERALYWTESDDAGETSAIKQLVVDTGRVRDLATFELSYLSGLAVDEGSGLVAWRRGNDVYYAPLSGAGGPKKLAAIARDDDRDFELAGRTLWFGTSEGVRTVALDGAPTREPVPGFAPQYGFRVFSDAAYAIADAGILRYDHGTRQTRTIAVPRRYDAVHGVWGTSLVVSADSDAFLVDLDNGQQTVLARATTLLGVNPASLYVAKPLEAEPRKFVLFSVAAQGLAPVALTSFEVDEYTTPRLYPVTGGVLVLTRSDRFTFVPAP